MAGGSLHSQVTSVALTMLARTTKCCNCPAPHHCMLTADRFFKQSQVGIVRVPLRDGILLGLGQVPTFCA